MIGLVIMRRRLTLTGIVQRSPECDMALVHDDDLGFLVDSVSLFLKPSIHGSQSCIIAS